MLRSVAIAKRAIDIIFSFLVLIVFFVPCLILCGLIVLESPGAPIYRQKRLRRHVRESLLDHSVPSDEDTFWMYKLRTMKINAEENGVQNADKNDTRVTKIGRILRKTRLDEIPNFINVLLGDMSIVGPRADRIEIQKNVTDDFPLIWDRTSNIKPGITGLAQLYLKSNGEPFDEDEFLRHVSPTDANREVLSFRYKLYYEAVYRIMMTNFWWFLKTDLMIMFKTPMVMFFKKSVI